MDNVNPEFALLAKKNALKLILIAIKSHGYQILSSFFFFSSYKRLCQGKMRKYCGNKQNETSFSFQDLLLHGLGSGPACLRFIFKAISINVHFF